MLLKRLYDPDKLQEYQTQVDEKIGQLWENIDMLLRTGQVTLLAGGAGIPAEADEVTRAAAELIQARMLSEADVKGKASDLVRRPPVFAIKILSAGPRQNFSENIIQLGMVEGWLTAGQGKIILHDADGQNHAYRIERLPGHYCCYCGMSLDGGGRKKHVKADHRNEKSPDPNNPSGYRRDNFYACVKEE